MVLSDKPVCGLRVLLLHTVKGHGQVGGLQAVRVTDMVQAPTYESPLRLRPVVRIDNLNVRTTQ